MIARDRHPLTGPSDHIDRAPAIAQPASCAHDARRAMV
jgi:hypothetical protein